MEMPEFKFEKIKEIPEDMEATPTQKNRNRIFRRYQDKYYQDENPDENIIRHNGPKYAFLTALVIVGLMLLVVWIASVLDGLAVFGVFGFVPSENYLTMKKIKLLLIVGLAAIFIGSSIAYLSGSSRYYMLKSAHDFAKEKNLIIK